jgi:hypothetical protein
VLSTTFVEHPIPRDLRSSRILRNNEWYRRFGTTYRSHFQGSRSPDFLTLGDVTDTLPQKSVKNYHSTLRNTPEEHRHQHRGGSLKSRTPTFYRYSLSTFGDKIRLTNPTSPFCVHFIPYFKKLTENVSHYSFKNHSISEI